MLFVYKIQRELFQGIIGMELHLSSFEMWARNGSRKGKTHRYQDSLYLNEHSQSKEQLALFHQI